MDKTTPFFSIVMPVYGVADYLEQTLQSVAAQTFEDFEVILVDDCSPDDSPKICDAWVKKDERMTVLHLPENGGLSNARNAGFPHVRGEYVFFMDSDDVIDANLLEQVKASLEVNRADVVVFGLLEQYYDRAGVLKQTFPVAVEKTLYLYTPEDVRGILETKDRESAGVTAPPHGLMLMRIEYEKDLDKSEGDGVV